MGKLVEQVQRSVSMSQLLPIGTPRKGMLCLAEYCTDKKWYRARIIGRLLIPFRHAIVALALHRLAR